MPLSEYATTHQVVQQVQCQLPPGAWVQELYQESYVSMQRRPQAAKPEAKQTPGLDPITKAQAADPNNNQSHRAPTPPGPPPP